MTARSSFSILLGLALLPGLTLVGACKQPAAPTTQPVVQPDVTPAAREQPFDTSTIELAVAEDPSVVYAAWFRVGSQNDPQGKEGLAWLTSRLIAEGGTKQHSWPEIVDLLYPLAARWDVQVDREMTVIRGRSHVDTTERFQMLLTEQLTTPAFDAKDFERLRSEGLNYLRTTLRYASDEELGKAGLEWFVFDEHPYQHPVNGTVAGLESITLDDVKAFYNEYYTADNVVFAIGGNFQPGHREALEATRSALPAGAPAPLLPHQAQKIEGKQVLLIHKPGADASISFGHPLPVLRGDKDFYALWLANSWLGEHRNSSSHLFQVIREVRGLNYGDYSYVEAFPNGGFLQMPPTNVARNSQLFQIWIRTLPNEHAVFALKAAHRELAALVGEGMTAEEFELTREFLRKYILHFAETTQDRLGYAIDDRFYGLDQPHLERFAAELDKLTVDDVNRALEQHLDPDNMKIVIVTGQPELITEQLLSSEPISITYPSPKPDEVLLEDKAIGAYKLGIREQAIQVVPVDEMFAK